MNVLPPPANPLETASNNWGGITRYFGKALPTDYMLFVDQYGSGEIGEWLTVFNPFSQNPNLSLLDSFRQLLTALASVKEESPEDCPFPLMFEPGGLLPWGQSIDGDIFCWLTPREGIWPVVIVGRHTEPEKFDQSMSQFLLGCMQGKLSPLVLPSNWLETPITFQPKA